MREITKKGTRKPCKVCHKKFYYISQNGLCKNCMMEKIKLARSQIKCKQGPVYEKWKEKIIKSLEVS